MQINPSYSISPTTIFTHRFRLTENILIITKKRLKGFRNTPTTQEHSGQTRMRQDNPALASMVSAVDDSVGTLLAKLDELNLSDNTVIIFFSDNGGLSTKPKMGPGSNSPLRAGKGWLYEGGVREPTIIRAPGVTKAGSVSNQPIVSMDSSHHARTRRTSSKAKASCRWSQPTPELQGRKEKHVLLLALPTLSRIDMDPGSIHSRRRLEANQIL